jgi:hypothetical protein
MPASRQTTQNPPSGDTQQRGPGAAQAFEIVLGWLTQARLSTHNQQEYDGNTSRNIGFCDFPVSMKVRILSLHVHYCIGSSQIWRQNSIVRWIAATHPDRQSPHVDRVSQPNMRGRGRTSGQAKVQWNPVQASSTEALKGQTARNRPDRLLTIIEGSSKFNSAEGR